MAERTMTVGQVNTWIKNLFNGDHLLSRISVKGEVSNCTYHGSGAIYFSLKDASGTLGAVMFNGDAVTGLKFKLENGQQVVVSGRVSVFEKQGRYQLYAREISLDGVGNLHEQYELLKQKLYDQGLFEFDIKKEIPKFPKKVGIVTAKTGAAIQDICNIARRRNPFVQLILYPAKVQGEGAAAEIARGIEVLDRMDLDTIIVGRGGGSIEDLWAFNEEVVAWAIFNAETPIISGTGHEIDNTIADYVADLRAPTPSAAAELAIPDVMSTINNVEGYGQEINRLMKNKVTVAKEKLNAVDRHLHLLNPVKKLQDKQMYLDTLTDKLNNLMKLKYERRANRFNILCERLNGLSPLAKLVNGFGYLEKENAPVKSVVDVAPGDRVEITLSDGKITTEVI